MSFMMTYKYYKSFKRKQLIQLLLRYQQHAEAHDIAGFLDMEDKSEIYEDWAIAKMQVRCDATV